MSRRSHSISHDRFFIGSARDARTFATNLVIDVNKRWAINKKLHMSNHQLNRI